MNIQQAELFLDGYGKRNWHLIPPTNQEYLEAAQVFAAHQASIGRPIEYVELKVTSITSDCQSLHGSWSDAVIGVFSQRIWATKEILKNAS